MTKHFVKLLHVLCSTCPDCCLVIFQISLSILTFQDLSAKHSGMKGASLWEWPYHLSGASHGQNLHTHICHSPSSSSCSSQRLRPHLSSRCDSWPGPVFGVIFFSERHTSRTDACHVQSLTPVTSRRIKQFRRLIRSLSTLFQAAVCHREERSAPIYPSAV